MTEQTKTSLGYRIAQVMKAVEYIKKNETVGSGTYAYQAVTHDEVTGILRQHFIEQGIRVVPRIVPGSAKSIPIVKGGKSAEVSGWIRFEAEYTVDLVSTDDAADRETYSTAAHADDNGDKAPGKALSYAVKAVLLKAFSIETGEDDESRFGSDDAVDVDTVVETINGFSAATTRPALRDLLKAALVASQADPKTMERYQAAAKAAAEKLPPEIKQPSEKAAPRAEPVKNVPANDGPVETVSTVHQTTDDDEPRASAGLVKSIRNLIDTKGLDEPAVKKITKGAALETMSKSQAAKVLAAVSAS